MDPDIQSFLSHTLGVWVATPREWEAAFRLCFGNKAFEEDYLCIDWTRDSTQWGGDAEKFAAAFVLADQFVAAVMHRLFPFQQKEMIPALTHALIAWTERRETSLPRGPLEEALNLLAWS